MSKMKAVQVGRAQGAFEVVEREVPEPGRGEVLIRVAACGICHSDLFVKAGVFPGLVYPRVPGHEVAGVVAKAGSEVTEWKAGDRVGVGWHGGHCFVCEACREGDFINCRNEKITGISFDGGYAEYMVAPAEAVARLPEEMPADQAAPLLCAGVTTFNALRNCGARPGDVVAIQGLGGLGHLAIQYAAKMGFLTVGLVGTADKIPLAIRLGAKYCIDTKAADPAKELAKMGGAKVILCTAPDSKAMSALVGGLGTNGKLMVIGVGPDPITVTPIQLIGGRHSIQGWASGDARDSEDTLKFSKQTGVQAMIETFPLEKAAEAFERMMSGKVRFRAVLTM